MSTGWIGKDLVLEKNFCDSMYESQVLWFAKQFCDLILRISMKQVKSKIPKEYLID